MKKAEIRVMAGIKMFDVRAAAEAIGVTTPVIRLYIRKGKIKATVISGKYFIAEPNLQEFLLNPGKYGRMTPGKGGSIKADNSDIIGETNAIIDGE